MGSRYESLFPHKQFNAMKHSIYLVIAGCLLFSQSAFAQPETGSMILGGNVGFNAYKYGDYSSSTVYLNPYLAYFFTDQLAAGASVTLDFYGGDDSGSDVGIGPFARYYINTSGAMRFFGQAGIAFYNIKPNKNVDSYTSFGFMVGVGGDYFLNPNVALEALLGFSSSKDKDAPNSDNNFGLNIGVAAFFGGGD